MAPPLVIPKDFKQFFFKSCFIDPSIVASINMNLMLLLLI